MASNSCSDNLDHPEVLDREDLIEILNKRCIPIQEIDNLDKDELVLLFYKYVSPLPQRLHQLRRSKREPPKSSKNTVLPSSSSVKSATRKRSQEFVNNISKVKIPKSDLEHVLINNGPSKIKNEESNNSSLVPKEENPTITKTNAVVKTKPVKLNRKSLNLELNTSTNNSRQSQVNTKSNIDNITKGNLQLKHKDLLDKEDSSDSSVDDVLETKKKFKKIAISWP